MNKLFSLTTILGGSIACWFGFTLDGLVSICTVICLIFAEGTNSRVICLISMYSFCIYIHEP